MRGFDLIIPGLTAAPDCVAGSATMVICSSGWRGREIPRLGVLGSILAGCADRSGVRELNGIR